MQTSRSHSPLILRFFLFVSLAFNQGLGLVSSSAAMAAMQSFTSDDVLAICTGQTVKWISADAYFTSGQVLEVEAPTAAPESLHEVSCVLVHLADLPNSLENQHALSIRALENKSFFYALVRNLNSNLQAVNLARAPPHILFS